MLADRPAFDAGLDDGPAQACMCVNETICAERYQEVVLRGAGPDQQDIAPPWLAASRLKARLRRSLEEAINIDIA